MNKKPNKPPMDMEAIAPGFKPKTKKQEHNGLTEQMLVHVFR